MALSAAELKQASDTFKVINSLELDFGSHSVTFNHIEPPILPVKPLPEPVALSEAEEQEVERRARKQHVSISLSATIYDKEVTELTWTYQGRDYRAFSNIDFNIVRMIDTFETADTVYALNMGLGNETRQAASQQSPQKQIPFVTQFDQSKADFKLASSRRIPTEALKGIEALHAYYNTNSGMLMEKLALQEKADQDRAQWLKENPELPKNIITNFWLVKGMTINAETEAAK